MLGHKTDKCRGMDGLRHRGGKYSIRSSGIAYLLYLFDLLSSALAFSQVKANASEYLLNMVSEVPDFQSINLATLAEEDTASFPKFQQESHRGFSLTQLRP